jgi:hypothetical protein
MDNTYYPEDIEPIVYITKNNRIQKLKPKHYHAWCAYCDGDLVREGGKCRRCGKTQFKNRHLKFKKD